MSKTSWNKCFAHKQSCPMKNKTPALIETRLRLGDLKAVFKSFDYSISNKYVNEKLEDALVCLGEEKMRNEFLELHLAEAKSRERTQKKMFTTLSRRLENMQHYVTDKSTKVTTQR